MRTDRQKNQPTRCSPFTLGREEYLIAKNDHSHQIYPVFSPVCRGGTAITSGGGGGHEVCRTVSLVRDL
jgi:hypothetical protein